MPFVELHNAFTSFLTEKITDSPNRVEPIIVCLEQDVLSFINEQFGNNISSIYDISDPAIIRNLQKAIIANPVLCDINRSQEDVSYTDALNWYRRFLVSKSNPANPENDGPALVPAEGTNVTPVFTSPETNSGKAELHEGAEVQMDHVTTHERNGAARKECIAYFKSLHNGHIICECCGFDFSKAYRDIGDDYIEIHHRFPVSQRGGDYVVDPKTDLVPLCSNCHSMIHRIGGQGECMALEDLKARYIGKNYDKD